MILLTESWSAYAQHHMVAIVIIGFLILEELTAAHRRHDRGCDSE